MPLRILAPVLAAFIVLLLSLRIQVETKIIIKNGKNFSFCILRFFRGLLPLRFNLSLSAKTKGPFSLVLRKTDSGLETETDAAQAMRLVSCLMRQYRRHQIPIAYFKRKVHMKNFSVRSRVGVGNAAATALVTGGFYIISQTVIRHLSLRYALKNSQMLILPYFEGSVFDLDLDCIIHFRFGHIMITGFKMLKQILKGGENNV